MRNSVGLALVAFLVLAGAVSGFQAGWHFRLTSKIESLPDPASPPAAVKALEEPSPPVTISAEPVAEPRETIAGLTFDEAELLLLRESDAAKDRLLELQQTRIRELEEQLRELRDLIGPRDIPAV